MPVYNELLSVTQRYIGLAVDGEMPTMDALRKLAVDLPGNARPAASPEDVNPNPMESSGKTPMSKRLSNKDRQVLIQAVIFRHGDICTLCCETPVKHKTLDHVNNRARDHRLENLVLLSRLWGYSRVEARRRAGELLETFGLSDAADRQVKHYSGGMRRRIDSRRASWSPRR